MAIAIVACVLFFWYSDVQRIAHRAWGWFGGLSSPFTDPWKQSGAPQVTGRSDDRWEFLWSDEPSTTLGSYATEKLVDQSN